MSADGVSITTCVDAFVPQETRREERRRIIKVRVRFMFHSISGKEDG
jgi:hypothetical protein